MKSLFSPLSVIVLFFLLLAACRPEHNERLHFAWLTDLHVSPGTPSSEQLRAVVKDINALAPDLVVITGDITNHGSGEELRHVKKLLGELGMPYHILPGNHETNWSESAGQDFQEFWGDDKFLFCQGSFLFAGLNTGPFMRMGDGHVKQQDIAWLRRELSEKAEAGLRLLFFSHYPLAEGLDQWYLITDILKAHDARLALCGHGHRQDLLNFDGIQGVMGRSMVLRGQHTPGYNLVEITPDSVFVFEKEVGSETAVLNHSLSLDPAARVQPLPYSDRPDYSINEVYPEIGKNWLLTDTASVFTGPLLVGDSLLIYGNSLGHLHCYAIADKRKRWTLALEGPLYATPVLAGELVIAGGLDGKLYGIDPGSGRPQWSFAVKKPLIAPAVVKDAHLYLGGGSGSFYKICALSGREVWRFDGAEGLIQAAAVIEGDAVVFAAWDTHMYCLDRADGRLRWKWNNQSPVRLFSPGNVVPVISGGTVFVVAPDRYMTAIDLESGHQRWRTGKHQVRESMGVSGDRLHVYVKLMNDSILSVKADPGSFQTAWILDAGFGYDHNPAPLVSHGGMLFAATKNGLIMAIDENKGEVVWQHKAGNSAVNFMTTTESRELWVSTADGKIFSIPF